ncbi:hypothetical protein Scep_001382 [Stephania cephalantha]|uniref:Uncharacterized protein n=1 Tax=Stephania cephalantha TaxID=152367 RepID=A0AAP0L825_9MAGN
MGRESTNPISLAYHSPHLDVYQQTLYLDAHKQDLQNKAFRGCYPGKHSNVQVKWEDLLIPKKDLLKHVKDGECCVRLHNQL